jgi:dolichol-phosphate mannosyltransferase
MSEAFLVALPVFNEQNHVSDVLDHVARYSSNILVVDDGSTDATASLLAERDDVAVLRHESNLGYGAALRSAFDFAQKHDFDVLVTIDCDGQHQPQRIPEFVSACRAVGDCGHRPDIVSGSRYLKAFEGDSAPPAERRSINMQITEELNDRLSLKLTDAFCGFKAYRVASLSKLETTDPGYAMPLELWVLAARAELRVIELPVPLVYLEEKRSFGGELDNGASRLAYYHRLIEATLQRLKSAHDDGDREVLCGESAG